MKGALIIVILFCVQCFGQESPFNKRSIQVQDDQNFKFIVSGHFHGDSKNVSGFPAATLLGNLDEINSKDAAFMMSLGDLFLSLKKDVKNYDRVLFSKLDMPLFNAVGNHDIEEDNYKSKFGKTYFWFTVGDNVMIVLDTELDNGDIEDAQLKMLKKALKQPAKNYFVFAHRPIWSEYHEELEDVFKGNTSSGTNFGDEIYPLLKKATGQVYMFGGSIGGEAPVSFFYHKKGKNVHYIANAIRNLPRDGMLLVEVLNGEVKFTPFSLTGQNLKSLESYNLNYWDTHDADQGFNWRLLPLYIFQMLQSWHFWVGVVLTVLGGLFILWIRKRRRLKKAA